MTQKCMNKCQYYNFTDIDYSQPNFVLKIPVLTKSILIDHKAIEFLVVLGDNKKCHHGYRHDLPYGNHDIPN